MGTPASSFIIDGKHKIALAVSPAVVCLQLWNAFNTSLNCYVSKTLLESSYKGVIEDK